MLFEKVMMIVIMIMGWWSGDVSQSSSFARSALRALLAWLTYGTFITQRDRRAPAAPPQLRVDGFASVEAVDVH